MAGSVNKVILVGNLGRDPESRKWLIIEDTEPTFPKNPFKNKDLSQRASSRYSKP